MSGPPPIPDLAYTDPVAYSLTLPPIYQLTPAYGAVTDNNHGAYVVIVAWIMMCFFVLSVLTRLIARLVPITLGGLDDVLSGISMVFGIAQTATIYRSASNGLGQHESSLSSSSFSTYAKDYYTANLLYILTIACAKASLILLIVRLSPARKVQRLCYVFLALIALWTLIFLFLFAFQNSLPRPWDYTRTPANISTAPLYYSLGATDILTDLLVTLLPAYVIWNVQIPFHKRLTVIAVFAVRLVVPLCAAIRMSTLPPYVDETADRSWEAVTPQTWTQVVMCLSIITACIPCLKPFLESLESGFMDMSMAQRSGMTYGGASSGSGGGGGRQVGKSTTSRNKGSRTGESYVLSSLTSANSHHGKGRRQQKEVDVHAKASEQYAGRNRYLTSKTSDLEGNNATEQHPQVRRNTSLTESERQLTAKSSNESVDDVRVMGGDAPYEFAKVGELRSPSGIRVTREVEVRAEDEEIGRASGGEGGLGGGGRRW